MWAIAFEADATACCTTLLCTHSSVSLEYKRWAEQEAFDFFFFFFCKLTKYSFVSSDVGLTTIVSYLSIVQVAWSMGWGVPKQKWVISVRSQAVTDTQPTAASMSVWAGRSLALCMGYHLPVLTRYSEWYMCCLRFPELFCMCCPKYLHHQGALQGPRDIWTLREQ